MRIALQLYSLRSYLEKNFEEVIRWVADIGFEGVEFAGFYGKDPNWLREFLSKAGLEVAGAHIPLNAFSDREFEKTIAFNKSLGNKYLIIPGAPKEMIKTRGDWISFSKTLNNLANKLKIHGMKIGYHNHRSEFELVEGERPWDIIFSNTVSDVIMQLDIGHALAAKLSEEEIITVIKKYRGRAVTIHVKDYSKKKAIEFQSVEKGYEVVLGEGDTKWLDIIKALKDYGNTEWLIIEQETYPYQPPIESIKKSYIFLRNLIATL
ncbi:sugar phosphate isomerase/epimerase [Ignisphaera sp. 4213-co]|uniref:Sugar phosphate isomerase/epimerase n=1 Tax=Ignisphaera cupida TaxID=3050454 RepID=A0ABD4Z5Q0_9CREN|nr:sugar phosphate isomerase/epimerase [Ignisphaera sp. 4213-co]MDK6028490.1 sugar phosphate isomerase/epimerase [Ignisphaera sp. 4213-co]